MNTLILILAGAALVAWLWHTVRRLRKEWHSDDPT